MRRVIASVRTLLCLLAGLLLAGCAGPARKVTPLEKQEAPRETREPAPEIQRVVPHIPETGWVSLPAWCERNGLRPPVINISATETNIQIANDLGVFSFEPPRRNARWNNLLIGSSFPIQFTDGRPYIHALDITRLVRPLMFPSTAPARKTGGIIVIDPGHGGANEGARSRDRLMEKHLTLDWAKRVEKLLAGSAWKVYLTRETDIDLSLTQRVAFAEMKRADIFVSLHFNSFSNGEEAGLETYCITPQYSSSHLTRGYADEIDLAVGNNQFDIENLQLAHDMHRAMLKKTGRKDRGIRRARFMTVLREQNRPAVLLEGGYLSNPEEARLIASEEFRQKLAEAVVEALGVTP